MDNQYYQLSKNYEDAYKLLNQGRWLVARLGEVPISIYLLSFEGIGLCVNGVFKCEINTYSDFLLYCQRYHPNFLLPTSDPTIELQHSLTAALNECDELRTSLESASVDSKDYRNLLVDVCKKLNFSDFIELKNWTKGSCESRVATLECALADISKESRDRKVRIGFLLDEIATARQLLQERDCQISIMGTEIDSLRVDVEGYRKAHEYTLDCQKGAEIQLLGYKQRMELLENALRDKNQKIYNLLPEQFDIHGNVIPDPLSVENLLADISMLKDSHRDDLHQKDREICQLTEDLAEQKRITDLTQNRWEKSDAAYRNQISILGESLERSESDRLAQLTMIMRMVQALEDTPQDKREGAIYLIKRVLFSAICKLDPSQAIEL